MITGEGPKPKILLVEDDEDNRVIFEAVLSYCGLDVRTAEGGAEALRLCREWHPSVMIVDLGLPDMDGVEVLRRVRTDETLYGIRVIALTGRILPFPVARIGPEGFDRVLLKPATPLSVVDAVREVLGEARTR